MKTGDFVRIKATGAIEVVSHVQYERGYDRNHLARVRTLSVTTERGCYAPGDVASITEQEADRESERRLAQQ